MASKHLKTDGLCLLLLGVGAYFGAGMEVTLGAGVSLFFGAHLQDYNGLYNQVGRSEPEASRTLAKARLVLCSVS